jgi:hypothetical protein
MHLMLLNSIGPELIKKKPDDRNETWTTELSGAVAAPFPHFA